MSHARTIHLSVDDLGLFFDPSHQALAEHLRSEAVRDLSAIESPDDSASAMGDLGLYAYLVPEPLGGAKVGKPDDATYIDVRSLVLIREALGQISPLADAIFAVQGLGSYPIVLAGTDEQKRHYLPSVITGKRITGFGLTEPEAGSDVASLQTTATRREGAWVLDGEKTLISNVPIAQHYVVFASADRALGRKGISAFVVEDGSTGLSFDPIPMSIPHPIGNLHLEGCRVPESALLGAVGGGFSLAMATLDAFRISVGAAAVGMARRALAAAIEHVTTRRQFGQKLAEQQQVLAYLAEMATELDASRLLVARAAHLRDTSGKRVSVEAAMAKMFATEAAQRIIDKAVQLHGGRGVTLGSEVEALYREIRPLRIYEGTTEIQKLIIGKALTAGAGTKG
ncbi:MAG: acyl-CoA dehydrogenase family protein [Byssovorax sp.]